MEIPVSSGRKIDTKVWFNSGAQILFSTSDAASNASPQHFFQSPDMDVESLPIPDGFEVMLPASMNATGDVVGKVYRDLYSPNYAEAGFVRFPGENPEIATNLDPTQSYLAFVSDLGSTAGASRFISEGFSPFVTTLEETIVLLGRPPGYGYFEVIGLSNQSDVLLFAADDELPVPPQRRLALAAPEATTVLLQLGAGDMDPWSSAMNPAGDIATVVKNTVLGGADIRFLPAADRTGFLTGTSPGDYDLIYGFAMNAHGQVVFAKQLGGQSDQVVFADVPNQVIRAFSGYRPMINDLGEVVFGNNGAVMYLDTRVPGTQPAPVPVNLPQSARGEPELLAFNNAGQVVLSYFNADATTQSIGVFEPVAAPTPTPTPVPTPTPIPTPKPRPNPPAPMPAPVPTPNPIEQRIEVVENMMVTARKVKNPRARQARLRRLNVELRRLRALNAFEQQN